MSEKSGKGMPPPVPHELPPPPPLPANACPSVVIVPPPPCTGEHSLPTSSPVSNVLPPPPPIPTGAPPSLDFTSPSPDENVLTLPSPTPMGLPPPPPLPTGAPPSVNSVLPPSPLDENRLPGPPPLPVSPTSDAFSVPKLDMDRYIRAASVTLPRMDQHRGAGLSAQGTSNGMKLRQSSVSDYEPEKKIVTVLTSMFPDPPDRAPNPDGWDDEEVYIEAVSKEKKKQDFLFQHVLDFTRYVDTGPSRNVTPVGNTYTRVSATKNTFAGLLSSLGGDELKVLVEKAFRLASLDAGIAARSPRMKVSKSIGSRLKTFQHLTEQMVSSVVNIGARRESAEANLPHIDLDRHEIVLSGPGGCEIDVDQTVSNSFVITNAGKKPLHVSIDTFETTSKGELRKVTSGDHGAPYRLTFTAEGDGDCSKDRHGYICVQKESKVTVVVEFKSSEGDLEVFVPFGLNIVNGPRLLGVVKARVSKSYFGVNPETIPLKAFEDGRQVPLVLVNLHQYLIDHRAFEQVGIFRLAGNEVEMAESRRMVNQDRVNSCKDSNCIATLIKVWFRKLPKLLFEDVDAEVVLSCKTTEDAIAIYETLPTFYAGILLWLLDVMCEVVRLWDMNKMDAQNCAIVMGPNLFFTDQSSNPMQALMVSQKSVVVLKLLIEWRLEQTRGAGKVVMDT